MRFLEAECNDYGGGFIHPSLRKLSWRSGRNEEQKEDGIGCGNGYGMCTECNFIQLLANSQLV